MSETLKFKKIHRRLDQITLLDFEYCDVFDVTSEKLVPILNAIDTLIAFLNSICTEGNLLSFDDPSRPIALSSISSGLEGPDLVNPNFTSEACPTTVSRPPSPEPAYYSFPPLPGSPLPSPPHPTTPSWKLRLAYKYPVENLYVGEAELEVFAKVLVYAREARDEIIAADKTCKDLSDFALDMLPVFESWMEKCDKFDAACRARENAEDASGNYRTYDGGFEGSRGSFLR